MIMWVGNMGREYFHKVGLYGIRPVRILCRRHPCSYVESGFDMAANVQCHRPPA